jgi:hypothetical protein
MTGGVKAPMPGPGVVARRVARLVRHPRREVVVPAICRGGIWFDRHLPWLVERFIRPGQGTM